MKLAIGENIRNFRKKNDLTQEALADRLGVTYQSISRWENGTTYPDLELIPAIAEVLSVTVDELLGMPQLEKEKRAVEAFDELRRECMKRDYDADKIVNLLRDIRRNYLNSDSAWRPWVEGNDRAFRDPKILPEVRLLAEAYFEKNPMSPHVIRTMAVIEDEEHLEHFLKKHTTSYDCSAHALLFNRYWRRGDYEKFEAERQYQLFRAIDTLFSHRYLLKKDADAEFRHTAEKFMEDFLTILRSDAIDDHVDMWVASRLEQGFNSAAHSVELGNFDDAISKLKLAVQLFEKTMEITDEIILPTSCRFLEGMKWTAKEHWDTSDNDPDAILERDILIEAKIGGTILSRNLFPSEYLDELNGKEFKALCGNSEFEQLCDRIKALIVTKQKES